MFVCTEIRSENDCNVNLQKNEIYFLRLLLLNKSDLEIMEFLNVNTKEFYQIKSELKVKFKTRNWTFLLNEALQTKYLKKQDFLHSIVKNEAIKHAEDIILLLNDLKLPITYSMELTRFLSKKFIKYYYLCQLKIRKTYYSENREVKLTEFELEYLSLKIDHDFTSEDLKNKFKLNTKGLRILERSIFKKLEVSCWFNLLRIYQDIEYDKKDPLKVDFIEQKALDFSESLVIILTNPFRIQTQKEQINYVYNELIEFYCRIHFQYISYLFERLNNKKYLNVAHPFFSSIRP